MFSKLSQIVSLSFEIINTFDHEPWQLYSFYIPSLTGIWYALKILFKIFFLSNICNQNRAVTFKTNCIFINIRILTVKWCDTPKRKYYVCHVYSSIGNTKRLKVIQSWSHICSTWFLLLISKTCPYHLNPVLSFFVTRFLCKNHHFLHTNHVSSYQ